MGNLITNNIDTQIKDKIYTVRGLQVMLDRDIAEFYEVETKRVNEAVKNNLDKFPDDFYFETSQEEFDVLRSKISTTNFSKTRTAPKVFTEQGIYMLATILKSTVAAQVTVSIIRAFTNMRALINSNNLLVDQLRILEKRQITYEVKSDEKFEKVFNAIEQKQLKKSSGIFFNGQVFDAHSFISDLFRKATKSIVLIDNYIDDTILTLFSKIPTIKDTIYTQTQTKQLKLDLEKYSQQYNNVEIKTFKDSHDRFLILDDKEVYLVGASLKDLGKKWFGFSKLDISSIDNIL